MRRILPALLLLLATPAWAADNTGGDAMTLLGILVGLVVACVVVVVWNRAWGTAVTAIVGVPVTLYTTIEHIAAKHGGPTTCTISSAIDCTKVLGSDWSEVQGIPVSLLGMAFYLGMAWVAVKHARGQAPDGPILLVIGGVLAVGFDVLLGYQMFRVGAGCILCFTSYALNLLLLVGGTLLSTGRSFGASLGPALTNEAGVPVVIGLVGLIGGVLWYQGADKASAAGGTAAVSAALDPVAAITTNVSKYYEQVAGTIEINGHEPLTGDPNARFTLVEWADFQCPHCQHMWGELHELMAEHKDLKLMYKHYPISSLCNRFVEREGHTQACGAAKAAECARQQGRFWELSGQMFKNQEYLGPDDIRFMAGQLSLDTPALDACMARPETEATVRGDVDAGGKAGITGTPSLFLKGAVGDGWVRVNGGKEVIQTILAAARTGKTLPSAPPPAVEPG